MADWYKASLVPASLEEADATGDDDLPFTSRRSPVLARNGCVASSQPLASSIGLDLLRRGANAADAAVAVAAALAVTEPCSTGLGGDMFCLYYDSETRTVTSINGSGRSPKDLTFDKVKTTYPSVDGNGVDAASFRDSPHSVTVPGAARGWEDLLKKHGSGKFTFSEVLEPAALLAEQGFPVGPITSFHWKAGMKQITKWISDEEEEAVPLTVDGKRAPNTGDVVVNKDMARVLRDLGEKGATAGFYEGSTGQAIVEVVQKHGGCLTMDDLRSHGSSDFLEPICAEYRGVKLWQGTYIGNVKGVSLQLPLCHIPYPPN